MLGLALKRLLVVWLLVGLAACDSETGKSSIVDGGSVPPTVAVTPTAQIAASPHPRVSPSIVVSPSISATPSVTPSVVVHPTVEVTPTGSITPTVEVTPTATPRVTFRPSPTLVVTPSLMPTPTIGPTLPPTATPTIQPSTEPTSTPTATPTVSPTSPPTVTPSAPPPNQIAIRGVVQKGDFQPGATVQAQAVTRFGRGYGPVVSTQVGAAGEYQLLLPWSGPTRFEAEGYFQDEYTGHVSSESVSLNAQLDVSSNAIVNINLLTTLHQARATQLLEQGNPFDSAMVQVNAEIAAEFDLRTVAALHELDIRGLAGTGARNNAILLLVSYGLLRIVDEANVTPVGGPLSKAFNLPGGFADTFSDFLSDFADNAKFDGLAEQLMEKLRADARMDELQVAVSNLGDDDEVEIDPNLADDPPAWLGQRSLSVLDASTVAGGKLLLSIVLSSPTDVPVEVGLELVDGDAQAGVDYDPQPAQRITFNPGESRKRVIVKTHCPIPVGASPKSFYAQLSDPENAILGRDQATLVLLPPQDGNVVLADSFQIDNWLLESFLIDDEFTDTSEPQFIDEDDAMLAEFRVAVSVACRLVGPKTPPDCDARPSFLADIFLEGVQTAGRVQLGQTWVASEYINGRGSNEALRTVRFVVAPDASSVVELVRQKLTDGDSLRLVFEPRVANQPPPRANVVAPEWVPGEAAVAFGDAVVTDAQFSSLERNDFCTGVSAGTAIYEISGFGDWNPAPDDSWGAFPVQYGNVCASLELRPDGRYVFQVISGQATPFGPQLLAGPVGGLNVLLGDTHLDATGIRLQELVVALPSQVSAHVIVSGIPSRRGDSALHLSVRQPFPDSSDIRSLMAEIPAGIETPYLYGKGLPFFAVPTGLSLSQDGLIGSGGSIAYPHVPARYAERDVRRNGTEASNDARFRSGRLDAFAVDANGVQATVRLNAGVARMHFPRAEVEWKDTAPLMIVDNAIVGQQALAEEESVVMAFNPSCPGCQGGGRLLEYRLQGLGATYLAADASTMLLSPVGLNPRWGPEDHRVPGVNIFNRYNDAEKNGIFYVPGTVALGTAASESVAAYLLGARVATAAANKFEISPGAFFPLGSGPESLGNYHRAGINLGPEILVSAQAEPEVGIGSDLKDTGGIIGFGGLPNPDYKSLPSHSATKYVARPGGMTGVFNFSEAPSSIRVYDYPLELRRFAFRVVNNALDPYNWLDGRIDLAGDAGFELSFSSLGLECSGGLARGRMDYEGMPGDASCSNGTDDNANGVVDENCNTVLSAWQTDGSLRSIGFVADDANSCAAGPRQLEVGHRLNIAALSRPVGAVVRWSPDGDHLQSNLSSQHGQKLDTPEGDEGAGFSLLLSDITMDRSAINNESQGWFVLDTGLGVPFWNALSGQARVRNAAVGVMDQTAVLSELPGDHASRSNTELAALARDDSGYDLRARYTWGGTGFGINLPVYWDGGRAGSGEVPQLLGRTSRLDLIALEVQAGTDYINPARTQISFGASAEFKKIRDAGIRLNVDLSDPESLEEIDRMLSRAGIGGNPIQTGFEDIRAAYDSLNSLQVTGLERAMRRAVRSAVREATQLAGEPFRAVNEQFNALQTYSIGLADQFAADLVDFSLDVSLSFDLVLDQAIHDIYIRAPEVIYAGLEFKAGVREDPPDLVDLQDVRQFFALTTQRLDDVGQGYIDLQSHVDQALAVILAANDAAAPVLNALNRARNTIVDIQTDAAHCEIGPIEVPAGSIQKTTVGVPSREDTSFMVWAALDELESAEAVVEVLDTIDMVQALVEPLGSLIDIDRGAIEHSEQQIRDLVRDVRRALSEARSYIEDRVCESAEDLGEAIDPAIERIDELIAAANEVNAAIARLQNRSELAAAEIRDVIERNLSAIDSLKEQVTWLQHEFEQVVAEAGEPTTFTVEAYLNGEFQGPGDIRLAINDIYLEAFGEALVGPDDISIAIRMRNNLGARLDSAVANANARIDQEIAGLVNQLPYADIDALEDQIVDAVMESGIARRVQNDANAALSSVVADINELGLQVFDQVNTALQMAARAIEERTNALLDSVREPLKDLPMVAGGIDGYAVIAGDDLERLHLGANWSMPGDTDDSDIRFNAALDVTSWSVNGKGANCQVGDASSLLDAVISTRNLPLTIGSDDINIEKLEIGFTLDGRGDVIVPIGVNGGVSTVGTITFEAFDLYDVGFALGVGPLETYIGATAGGHFESTSIEAAFLVGRTCNLDVLSGLDPEVGSFIELPNGQFSGIYARGSASFPIFSLGCPLTVGLNGDVGIWALGGPPVTFGGVNGGGVFGRVACLAAIRGKATAFGQKSGGEFSFRGSGFGAAGAGWCEPSKWSSLERSRRDEWCATTDAVFEIQYRDGWELIDYDISGTY